MFKTRSLLLGSAASVALVGGAQGADLPELYGGRVEPSYPLTTPVSATNWNGYYVGLVAGGAWLDAHIRSDNPTGGGLSCNSTSPSGPSSCTLRPNGGLIGLTAGHNSQNGAYVYGLEVDWAATNLKKSISPGAGYMTRASMDWIATVRGRLGMAINQNRTLIYATAGLALAGIDTGFTDTQGGDTFLDKTKVGWVAGVGAEHMLSPRFSVKGEVLYHDFGSDTRSVTTGNGTYTTKFDHSVVTAKIGLNYKLPW